MAGSFTERLAYSGVAVFLPSYLIFSYGLEYDELAAALLAVSAGGLLGTIMGGRLADRRSGKPELVLVTTLLTALGILGLMLYQPGLWISSALGFVWALAASLGRPAFLWMMSELSGNARGTVMGLHVSMSSSGWVVASTVGGLLIAAGGFGLLATLSAAASIISAATATVIVVL